METKRILLLDDNEDILDIVQEVLKYENYEVKAIREAKGYLAVARKFRPDLLLLDFKLQDGHGGDICRAFKSDPEFKDVPVIIFSAYTAPDADFKAYGCDAVIAKPFSLQELTSTIHRYVNANED